MGDRGPWIQTFTGRKFYVLDPQPEDIDIADIAHALAHSSRFNGHCKDFYSIAQHSVFVSLYCDPEFAMTGLLHDAAEAYVGDIVSPIKWNLPQFKEIEQRVEQAIAKNFGITLPFHPSVKRADLQMLATEARDLMAHPPPEDWSINIAPIQGLVITPLGPKEAEIQFLENYFGIGSADIRRGTFQTPLSGA